MNLAPVNVQKHRRGHLLLKSSNLTSQIPQFKKATFNISLAKLLYKLETSLILPK